MTQQTSRELARFARRCLQDARRPQTALHSITVLEPGQTSPQRFEWSFAVVNNLAQYRADCTLDAIRDAVHRLEYDEAIARTLARVIRRETITPEMLSTVIPYAAAPFAFSMIALADGDRATALVDTSERGRFPDNTIGAAARALALHSAWYLDHELAERIEIQARRMATRWPGSAEHRHVPNLIGSLLHRVEGRPGSEQVLADDVVLMEFVLSQDRPTVERILFRSLDNHGHKDEHSSPPETHFTAGVFGGGHAVNAAPALPKVGRNEPCPCGSGKKSKRCHGADGMGLVASRSVSASDLRKMGSSQLARLDLLALSDDALVTMVREACIHGVWEHVDDAMATLMRRTSISRNEIDLLLASATEAAVLGRSYQAARNYAAQPADPEVLSALARAGIAIRARSADAFEHLLRAAEVAVREDSHSRHRDLASVLLDLAPGLGLLVSRGCQVGDEREVDILLDKTDEARAELGLVSGDPAREIQAVIRRASVHAKALLDATQTIDELRATTDRLTEIRRELEQRLAIFEREREQQEPRVSAQDPSPADADLVEVRRLRSKIEDLQDMVRIRNETIATLRRQAVTSAPEESPTNVEQHDYDDGEAWEDQTPLATRRLLVATWTERAVDSLATVPAHVAREALRTATEFAAGDTAAWRSVKRAKAVAVFMSRIGIHHRLLFRIDGRALAVLDLVTRQSLDVALRRYS